MNSRKRMSSILFYFGVMAIIISVLCLFFVNESNIFMLCTLVSLLVAIISWSFSLQVFGSYTKFYPLNTIKDYLMEIMEEDDLLLYGCLTGNLLTIRVDEIERGIWQIKNSKKEVCLHMDKYPFPITYLAGFFVRNFNYFDIRKNHFDFTKVYKPLKLSWMKKIKNIKLICISNGKKTEKVIVKNKKTKLNVFDRIVMDSVFWNALEIFGASSGRGANDYQVSEKSFKMLIR